jgi:amino acid transporter
VINALRAVLWSFLGIRRNAEYEKDTKRLTPQAVIGAGVFLAFVFVLALLGVVKLVTR